MKLSRIGSLLFLVVLALSFQNCAQEMPSVEDGTVLGSVNQQAECQDDLGNPIPGCVVQGSGDEMRACSIPHGTGLQHYVNNVWGACQPKNCDAGYTISGAACVFAQVVEACPIANGTGERINTGSGFGACQVKTCNANFEKRDGMCKPKTGACPIENGSGQYNAQGVCAVLDCNAGFAKLGGACVKNTRACTIQNGVGFQEIDAGKWGGCQIKSCNDNFEKWNGLCVKENAPTARVDLFVLRRNDGSGNELWDANFRALFVKQLTWLTKGNVKFVLSEQHNVKSTSMYNEMDQIDVRSHYSAVREFGAISAIVSNPGTVDSAGSAATNHNFRPYLVFRATTWPTELEMARAAGQIFLHELGHNMGMSHSTQTINIDNYYKDQPSMLVNYIKNMNACTSERCRAENQ